MTDAERIADLEDKLAAALKTNSAILERMETEHLRDQFAGQALAGMLAGNAVLGPSNGLSPFHHIARRSYAYADAMLEARKEKGNG